MPDTNAEPTPGPWHPHSDHRGHCYVTDGDDGRIDETEIAGLIEGRGGPHGDEPKANARLIAAAGTSAHEIPDEYDAVRAQKQHADIIKAADKFFHFDHEGSGMTNSPRQNILNAIGEENELAYEFARQVFNELGSALRKAHD